MATNDTQWCFCWHAGKPVTGAERAALVTGAKWAAGSTIEISFLDGSDVARQRVKDLAVGWLDDKAVRLRFSFRNDTTATPVRISFKRPGSWSAIGTTCRKIPAAQPSMNLGWLDGASDDAARRVVLHEFGHAIGLIHEHQNPDGGINWNKEAVYKELSNPPNSWSKEVIDANMFTPYAKAETNFTKVDKDSIMMYPLPAAWTLDGFSVGLNSTLSATDKSFVHEQYK